MRGSTSLQLLLLSAALVGGAAACGGGASESPSGSTQVIGPVILDATQTSATIPVGRIAVFNVEDPGAWALTAEPTDLVALTAGGEQEGATFNPGAEMLAPGTVEITLTNATTGETLTFQLTITE